MISHTRDDKDLGGSLNSLTKDFQPKNKGQKVCLFPTHMFTMKKHGVSHE